MNEDNTFLLAQQFEEYEQQMNRADAERWHGKGVVWCHVMHCGVVSFYGPKVVDSPGGKTGIFLGVPRPTPWRRLNGVQLCP